MKTKKTAWIVVNKDDQCFTKIVGNQFFTGDVMAAFLFWDKEDAFKMASDLGLGFWNAEPVDVSVRRRSSK